MDLFLLEHYREMLYNEPDKEFYFLQYIYHVLNYIHGTVVLSPDALQILTGTTEFYIGKAEQEPIQQTHILHCMLFMYIASVLCEMFIISVPFTYMLQVEDKYFVMLQRRKCCRLMPFYSHTQDSFTADLESNFLDSFKNEISTYWLGGDIQNNFVV